MTKARRYDTNDMAWTQHPQFPRIRVKHLETRATHPAASMMLVQIEAGGIVEPHVHQVETETAYVLQGQALLKVEAEEITLAKGVAVSIPPGLAHSLVNTGDDVLELFAVHTPPVR